jgi:hypothetical protein
LGEGYLGIDGVDGCSDALDHAGGVVDGADAMPAPDQGVCQNGISISGRSSRKPRLRTLW